MARGFIDEYPALLRLYNRLWPKRAAYRTIFGMPEGKAVLRDLAPFCFASAPATTERDIGRRDVWLRLQHFLQMDEEELVVLYAALSPEGRHQVYRPGQTFIEEE